MEMHQLRYVVAVAGTRNFSRAAEQCHVSQPSLSQQIQKLENELGERLFDRLKRQVKLTTVGENFVQRAAHILEEAETASREARDVQGLIHGTVAIGVLPTIAPYLLPRVIAAFAKKYPGLEVVVNEETTAQLLKLASTCEIDFAIVSLPIHDDHFVKETLLTEELLLAVPPGHLLAKRRSVGTADLETERFILMKEGHCLGDQVLRFCNRRDFQPQVSLRSTQIETIKALVRAGLGISLIPAMAVESTKGASPIYRSLGHPQPKRDICVVWPRNHPPGVAGQALLRVLRERTFQAKGEKNLDLTG
jgi:LysR family hydrogen peroxide-inducible transcriptional activator